MGQLSEPAAVRRLYDRLGFGSGGDALATAQRRGFAAAADDLLAVGGTDPGVARTPIPDLPVLRRPGRMDRGAAAAGADSQTRRQWRRQVREQQVRLTVWWLDRLVAAETPVVERLTWFWQGHFATSVQKVKSPGLMLRQNETMRWLGGGDFETLAQAMIIDPALLIWLDGNDNTAAAPNENLARESLELFMIGHGGYREADVKEAARALTGWVVDRWSGEVRLRARRHDAGAKTILGLTADFDAAGFVAHAVKQPASVRFLAARLWFRLVSATPPDDATLNALGAAYRAGGMLRLVAAITEQPAMRDVSAALVKQPVEWLVGLLRCLGVQPSELSDQQRRRLLAQLRGMGQLPFAPPSVGGWPSGGGWLTTAAARARFDVARLVCTAASLGPAARRTSARNRAEQVRRVLGVDRWSARSRAAIDQVADQLPAALAVAACAPEYVVSG